MDQRFYEIFEIRNSVNSFCSCVDRVVSCNLVEKVTKNQADMQSLQTINCSAIFKVFIHESKIGPALLVLVEHHFDMVIRFFLHSNNS